MEEKEQGLMPEAGTSLVFQEQMRVAVDYGREGQGLARGRAHLPFGHMTEFDFCSQHEKKPWDFMQRSTLVLFVVLEGSVWVQ